MANDDQGGSASKRTRMAPADRRARILDAASAMFRDRGYAGASVDAIAAASGISGPGLYRHFAGKAELLLALLDRAVADTLATIDAPSGRARDTDDLADILAERAIGEGAIVALLHGTADMLEAGDRARIDTLRQAAVGKLTEALCAIRSELAAGEAEARIIAALALVGQIERIRETAAPRDTVRILLRAILRA